MDSKSETTGDKETKADADGSKTTGDKETEVTAVSAADVLKAIKRDKPKVTILGEAGKDGKRKPVEKTLTTDHILAWSVSGKNVTATIADGTKATGVLG